MTGVRSLGWLVMFAVASAAPGCLLVTPLGDRTDHASASGGHGGSTSARTGGHGGVQSPGDAADGPSSGSSCTTNDECIQRLGVDDPVSFRCRPTDHTCVKLRTEECPLAFGEASNPNAVFIGDFATLNPAHPEQNSIVWSHELALSELSPNKVGGLPGGPGGARRPLVVIVCNADASVAEKGLSHLVDDVGVPAVLATLMPADLQTGFEAHRAKDIFYLSPVGVTSSFFSQDYKHLVWHLLGQPKDLAPAYQGLLALVEKYSRAHRGVGTRNLRVALVTTTDAFDSDLSNFVAPALKFNVKSAIDNESTGDYKGFTLDLASDAGSALTSLAVDVVNFRPDVVISTAGVPFTQTGGVLENIETYWQDPNTVDAGKLDRPMYILSPIDAGDLANTEKIISGLMKFNTDVIAYQRFVGVAAASAEDRTLQNSYASRLRLRFDQANPDTGNYYDAFYFLAYAMYAAGPKTPLTGSDIANGMLRLIGGGPAFGVGPDSINDVFQALGAPTGSIELDGTLGPPNFDPSTGSRIDDGSVFCFQSDVQTSLSLQTEVLRFHHDTGTFTGSFPCFPGFFP